MQGGRLDDVLRAIQKGGIAGAATELVKYVWTRGAGEAGREPDGSPALVVR